MSETSKSVSVSTFSGKEEDFELFWSRFEAYANMKGFAEALDWTTVNPDLPVNKETLSTDDDTKKKQKVN